MKNVRFHHLKASRVASFRDCWTTMHHGRWFQLAKVTIIWRYRRYTCAVSICGRERFLLTVYHSREHHACEKESCIVGDQVTRVVLGCTWLRRTNRACIEESRRLIPVIDIGYRLTNGNLYPHRCR